MIPTNESPVVITDRVQSTNYDPPDGSEIFADAGTNLDLNTGTFTSTGLTIDGETGDLNIRGNVDATTFTAEEIVSDNYDPPDVDESETYSDAGTRLNLQNGSFISPALRINGQTGTLSIRGNVNATSFTTNQIESFNYDGPDNPGEDFSDDGTLIDLTNGDIISRRIRIRGSSSDSEASLFEGSVTATGFDLSDGTRVVAEFQNLEDDRVGLVSIDESTQHEFLSWDPTGSGGFTRISAGGMSTELCSMILGSDLVSISCNVNNLIRLTSGSVSLPPIAPNIPAGGTRIVEITRTGELEVSSFQAGNLQSRIAILESSVTALQTSVTALTSRVAALEQPSP